MGVYDTVEVFQECPYCGDRKTFEAQTKDLNKTMRVYSSYQNGDYSPFSESDEEIRSKLPVFPKFPNDKGAGVWDSQLERSKAQATLLEELQGKLEFVEVVASCSSTQCQFDADREGILRQGCPSGGGRSFRGKIKVEDGMLVGQIYDVERDGLDEKDLDRYKERYPETFKKLKEEYSYEPIIVRNWPAFPEEEEQNSGQ